MLRPMLMWGSPSGEQILLHWATAPLPSHHPQTLDHWNNPLQPPFISPWVFKRFGVAKGVISTEKSKLKSSKSSLKVRSGGTACSGGAQYIRLYSINLRSELQHVLQGPFLVEPPPTEIVRNCLCVKQDKGLKWAAAPYPLSKGVKPVLPPPSNWYITTQRDCAGARDPWPRPLTVIRGAGARSGLPLICAVGGRSS